MSRTILREVIAVGVAASLACGPATLPPAESMAPHIGEGGVPQFDVDPTWPRIPTELRIGPGSAVTGDEEGFVWILSRPRVLSTGAAMKDQPTRTPAPPVMTFDQNGTYIQGWGGQSGPG